MNFDKWYLLLNLTLKKFAVFSSSLPDISQISRSEISIPHEILKKGRKEEDARQTDDFAERANAGPLFGWIQGKTRVKVNIYQRLHISYRIQD